MERILEAASPGTVVSVARGTYRHVGLLTEAIPGVPRRVISLNPGPVGLQVREELLSTFAGDQAVAIDGVRGGLSPYEVLIRARSGQHESYSWTQFNCEHFVRFAHGLSPESPQLLGWALVLGFAALFFVGSKAAA